MSIANRTYYAFAFFQNYEILIENNHHIHILEDLEKAGFNVIIFNGINDKNFLPHMLIDIINENANGELSNNCNIFITDIPVLCALVYKTYINTFNAFIILKNENIHYEICDSQYMKIYQSKAIQSNGDIIIFTDFNIDSNFINLINLSSSVIMPYHKFDVANIMSKTKMNSKIIFKHYNVFTLYEPIVGAYYVIDINKNISTAYNEITNSSLPKIWNTKFAFPIDITIFNELIDCIKIIDESPDIYFSKSNIFNNVVVTLSNELMRSNETIRNGFICYIEVLSDSYSKYTKIFLLSVIINITQEPHIKTYFLNQLYDFSINCTELSKEERHFLHWQLTRIQFVNANIKNESTAYLSRELYRKVYKSYLDIYKKELKFIPKNERNKNLLIIITGNILTLEHGPTKTTFDRAESFIRNMGKDVLVINTKEVLSSVGRMPFYNIIIGNVIQEYEKNSIFKYFNMEIPFRQVSGLMPNDNGMRYIIDLVKEKKPYLIFIIGSGSIPGDILSNIVPTVNQTLGPSSLSLTEGQFQVVGKKVTIDDKKLIESFGFSSDHIINSLFTMNNFKPQTTELTRNDLNIPEDKFILLIVGGRLDDEITQEFIEMLLSTIKTNTHITFAGSFDKYSYYCDNNIALKHNSTYIGFQTDILAVCELCNLYVNPNRSGGGTSSVEALFKGLPAVTLNFGDVALAVGNDFIVGSYNEMSEKIIKYSNDNEFYKRMSKKAKKRACILMDTDKSLENIIDKVISSSSFK